MPAVTPPNAAFYYMPDGYEMDGKRLMGRQSAGNGFLAGFVRHSGVDPIVCYAPNEQMYRHFRANFTRPNQKASQYIPFKHFHRLAEVGCMFVPGPSIGPESWVRRTLNSRAYSLCGVTHTTATERVMDGLGDLFVEPVQEWDAIVCTSTVVKQTVDRVLTEHAAYLHDRWGVRPEVPIQLPIIPLGVDCAQFQTPDAASHREKWRRELGIGPDDIVVLYVGRFNANAKAHPTPMYVAMERAAKRTAKKLWLVQAGWSNAEDVQKLFEESAARHCPSVAVKFLDGRLEDVRTQIWFAGDIFISLSDNIQETFGLTPIEAMAAGLPVVVSDWDGYKDTVRDRVDGFRIPTVFPSPGLGEDLAARFAAKVDGYSQYCSTIAQMTTIDVAMCGKAIAALADQPELRKKMGDAGKERARAVYDWAVVVRQYQALWQELSERRLRAAEIGPKRRGAPAMPLRQDPFALYREYPTGFLSTDTRVAPGSASSVEALRASPLHQFADPEIALTPDELGAVLDRVRKTGGEPVANLLKLFPVERRDLAQRSLGWLGKYGLVKLVPPA